MKFKFINLLNVYVPLFLFFVFFVFFSNAVSPIRMFVCYFPGVLCNYLSLLFSLSLRKVQPVNYTQSRLSILHYIEDRI